MIGVATHQVKSYSFYKHFSEPFDSGERVFNQPYLLYASQGSFYVESSQRTWLLLPHRAALIRAGLPIRIQILNEATSSSILFSDHLIRDFPFDYQIFPVTPLLEQMIHYSMRWNADTNDDDRAAYTFFGAIANVVIEAAQTPDKLWFPKAQSPELKKALMETLNNMEKPLLFSDIASVASASERTLARRFSNELGMSWIEFLQRARLIRATELLTKTNMTMAEITYTTGISSPSVFAKQFRNAMGETPVEFKRRMTRKN